MEDNNSRVENMAGPVFWKVKCLEIRFELETGSVALLRKWHHCCDFQIYSLPEFTLCYYVKSFPMGPKVIVDSKQVVTG